VVLATLLWPVNRWVMGRGGRPEAFGLATAVTAALISSPLALASGQSLADPVVWSVGAVIGVAFAVGYFMVIMHCLRIGPTGPTAAVNNMGLVWPVVAGLVWPESRSLGWELVSGLALVVVGLALFGVASSRAPAVTGLSRRWVAWVLLGWLLAGVSMTAQYVGTVLVPDGPLALTAAFYLVAVLVLTAILGRRGRLSLSRLELAGGAVNGLISAAAMVTTLLSLRHFRAEIVFPVTVALPILLVLLLSAAVYRERLTVLSWAACATGGAGLVVLTLTR
jgi:drug/metabolite transporter (DMT)-like permease